MDSGTMFPLDTSFLLFLKCFVVVTCLFFWVRLAYHQVFSNEMRRRTRRMRPRPDGNESAKLDRILAELDVLRKERDALLAERDEP